MCYDDDALKQQIFWIKGLLTSFLAIITAMALSRVISSPFLYCKKGGEIKKKIIMVLNSFKSISVI